MDVLRPGDVGYDGARTTWNACIDRRPAAIIRPQSTDDVRRALASSDDPVTVRGGGHHVTGACARDGAVMLDLRRMSRVQIAAGCAIVEGGALWNAVTIAAEQHNLAGAAGTVGSVGVVGLTLGGGLGWLTRRYGLACDSVNAVELVTADGSLLQRHLRLRPRALVGSARRRNELRRRHPTRTAPARSPAGVRRHGGVPARQARRRP